MLNLFKRKCKEPVKNIPTETRVRISVRVFLRSVNNEDFAFGVLKDVKYTTRAEYDKAILEAKESADIMVRKPLNGSEYTTINFTDGSQQLIKYNEIAVVAVTVLDPFEGDKNDEKPV